MKRWLGPLLALQFLTILPVGSPRQVGPDDFGRSIAYFPLIGLLVGALLAVLDAGLGLLFPLPVRSALTIAALLILTGALHFDGWLDLCDALVSHRSPSQRLEILRDSRVGGYAVAGGAVLLLVRWAALSALVDPVRLEAIVLMAAWGRLGIAYAVLAHPYGRTEARPGRFLKEAMTPRRFGVALLTAAVPAVFLWGAWSLLVLAFAWTAAEVVARLARSRLPGLTGDVYGAINEAVEVTILLVAVVIWA